MYDNCCGNIRTYLHISRAGIRYVFGYTYTGGLELMSKPLEDQHIPKINAVSFYAIFAKKSELRLTGCQIYCLSENCSF